MFLQNKKYCCFINYDIIQLFLQERGFCRVDLGNKYVDYQNKKQQQILYMNRGAKQNWFQSPHVKNGIWLFHDEKIDLFNGSKQGGQQRFSFLTPSHQSKPLEVQKTVRSQHNHSADVQHNKFQDINLPDMFSNTLVERQVINQKLNFQQSSVGSEENDYRTPSRQGDHCKIIEGGFYKDLPKTAAKEGAFNITQQKKPRPKQKGLRMLSQKAYQIVTKMNGATYKQVANKLVDELAVEDTVQINGKDQQNIKRRVYDALNVLIALGILKKDGRKIHGVRCKSASEEAKHEQLKKLMQSNHQRRYRIIQKMKKYKNTKLKAQMIKALIKRNQLFPAKQDHIEFPYICVTLQQRCQTNINFKKNRLQISSTQKIVQPLGDIDTMQFLRPTLRSFVE